MRTCDKAAYEGDIVSRLRNWRGLHLAHGGDLFEEAADEIERLREAIRRLAEQDATLSVQGGNVTVQMDATPEILEQLSQRGGPLVPFDPPQTTLSDAERKSLEWAILTLANSSGARVGVAMDNVIAAQQLRKLLERLGSAACREGRDE